MAEEDQELNLENSSEGEAQEQPDTGETENVVFESSMAMSVSARGDAKIENSMAMSMIAGNDLTAVNSLGSTWIAGDNLTIQDGGGVVMVVGNQAQVDHSTVGILVAGSGVSLTQGSKILMTGRQALALGVALGAAFAVLTAFLRRLR